jgi:hypothetical protein
MRFPPLAAHLKSLDTSSKNTAAVGLKRSLRGFDGALSIFLSIKRTQHLETEMHGFAVMLAIC